MNTYRILYKMNAKNIIPFKGSFIESDGYKKLEKILNFENIGDELLEDRAAMQSWVTIYSSKLESLKNIEYHCQATIEFIRSTRIVMDEIGKIIEKTNGFTCEITNLYIEKLAISINDWLGEWIQNDYSGLRNIIADDVVCESILGLYRINIDTDELCIDAFNTAIDVLNAIRSFAHSKAMGLIEYALYDDETSNYSLDDGLCKEYIRSIEADIITLNAFRTPTEFVEYKMYKTTDGRCVENLETMFKNNFLNEIVDIAGEQKDYTAKFSQRNVLKKIIPTPTDIRVFFGDDKNNNFADKLVASHNKISEKSITLLENICFKYFRMVLIYSVLTVTIVESQELFYNAFVKYIENAIDSYLVTTYKIQNDADMVRQRQKSFPLLSRFTAMISRNSREMALNAFLRKIDKIEPNTLSEIFKYITDLDASMGGDNGGKLLDELATIKANIVDLIVNAIDHESLNNDEGANIRAQIQRCFDEVFDDPGQQKLSNSKTTKYITIGPNDNEPNAVDECYKHSQYAIGASIYYGTDEYDSGVLFLMSNVDDAFKHLTII